MADVGQVLRDLVREIVREEIAEQRGLGPPSPKPENHDRRPSLDKAVYQADEVAALLGCSIKAVYAKNSRLQIPGGFKVGRRLQFRGAALVAWLKDGRVPSAGVTRR